METGLSNSIEKADTIILNIFSDLSDSMKDANKTVSIWKEVLYSIKNAKIDGSQLADHSKILEFKNGILVIETDHPGRIQLFQMYKNYIQTGINRKSPDLKVKNILFRLKKNEKNIKAENVEEIIREKILLNTQDEIPHSVAITIDKYQETDEIDRIYATIYCEQKSQKGILIGKGGSLLKKIGTEARIELEGIVDKKVFLALEVKVEKDWRKKDNILKNND